MNEPASTEPSFRRTLDPAENIYRDEMTELRIDRISHRLTFLSVLLPILLIVMLTLGYLDLKRRVTGIRDTGAAHVQDLSQDLASRFSSLSVRVAELEQQVARRLDALDHQNADLGVRIEQAQDAFRDEWAEALKSKADHKDLQRAAAALEQQIPPLTEAVETQRKALGRLDARLETQTERQQQRIAGLTEAAGAVEANVAAILEDQRKLREQAEILRSETATLGARKADEKAMAERLASQRAAILAEIRKAVKSLDDRLEALGRRVTALDAAQQALDASHRRPPAAAPATTPNDDAVTQSTPQSSDNGQPVPRPGQVLETPLD